MDPREGGGCQPTRGVQAVADTQHESLGHGDLPLPRHLRKRPAEPVVRLGHHRRVGALSTSAEDLWPVTS